MSGFEFGAGVPLITPLTGYNVFVGYVNKNASTWLGRRFGLRADFTIPTELKLVGTISDNPEKEGYIADAHGTILGYNIKMSDFSDKKFEIDVIEDDKKNQINIGNDGIDFTLKINNQNMGLLVDFYPFADTWFLGGIRLTGGYYVGDFKISAMAHINDNIDYRYNVGAKNNVLRAQIAKGSSIGTDFHWKYHGPYAGVGFDLGIWRGFKFFMDAGVVFADAPKVTDKNVHDDNLHLKGTYELYDKYGNRYSPGVEMIDILPDGIAEEPDVNTIIKNTVGIAIHSTLDYYSNPENQTGLAASVIDAYSAVVTSVTEHVPQSYKDEFCGGGNCEWNQINYTLLADNVIDFLGDETYNKDTHEGDDTAEWISTLIEKNIDLSDAVMDIKEHWNSDAKKAVNGVQKDVNQAWEDYDDKKHEVIDDINDFLKDYGMFPMVKIGFMYRF